MRYLSLLAFILCISTYAHAEWEQRFSAPYTRTSVFNDAKIWMGHTNGITSYDVETGHREYYSSVNSDMPGNYINTMLKLDAGRILVSSRKGLAIIGDGEITTDDPVCSTYPGIDARYLYRDDDNAIWTFDSKKIFKYSEGKWKTFDLSQNIQYEFDLWELYFHEGKVWALYNDNRQTTTTFYPDLVVDNYLKIAIIGENGVEKLLEDKSDFPYRQGSVSLISFGDVLWLQNADGIYEYKDGGWSNMPMYFTQDSVQPAWTSGLVFDSEGKVWFLLENKDLEKFYPVSYDPETKQFKEHLKEEEGSYTRCGSFNDSLIYAANYDYLCLYHNGKWDKYSFEELGIGERHLLYNLAILGGKKYFIDIDLSKKYHNYSYYCFEDRLSIPVYENELFFTDITHLAVNEFGQGMYMGEKYNERPTYVSDSGYVQPDLNTDIPEIKAAPDGKVYFSNVRNNNEFNMIATWEGTELIKIDMGYPGKEDINMRKFDFSGEKVISMGYYKYEADTNSSYITIRDLNTGEMVHYDKDNSCLPDFYWKVFGGIIYVAMDTIPRSISVGKDNIIWCLTSESLIEFSPGGCNLFKIPRDTAGYAVYSGEICYDDYTGQILLGTMFYFDIETEEYHPVIYENAGFKDQITKVKKLVDGNVWAAGNEGYLYRYRGDGIFKVYDLDIHGRQNLGIPINDFSMDVHGKLHLGTEIGLFSGEGVLSVPAESAEQKEVVVYPNPFTDMLYIAREGVSSYRLYDIFGNKAGSGEHTSIVSGNKLSPGIYFLRIFYFDGTHDMVKIIKNE